MEPDVSPVGMPPFVKVGVAGTPAGPPSFPPPFGDILQRPVNHWAMDEAPFESQNCSQTPAVAPEVRKAATAG